MDINPALEVDPNTDPNAGLRAAQIQRGLDAINRMIDLSLELAALIVQDAKQPAAEEPGEKPEAKAAKKPHHAADFDRLFRGVRRAVLVSQKLLDPPKPELANPERKAATGGKYPKPTSSRGDRDYPDRPDTIDNDPPAAPSFPDDAEILGICRQLNIKAVPNTTPLLDRPLADVEILAQRAAEALAKALQPLGLEIALGEFNEEDPPEPDTS